MHKPIVGTVKIEEDRGRINIAGYITSEVDGKSHDRKVFCLSHDPRDTDWTVSSATCASGPLEESLMISRVAVRCHNLMAEFKDHARAVGFECKLHKSDFFS